MKKRKLFLGAVVLTAVISLLAGWYLTLRKGINVGDSFYYKTGGSRYERNQANYIEFMPEQEFKIVEDGSKRTAFISFSDDPAASQPAPGQTDGLLPLRFDFSDGTSLSGCWNGEFFTDQEGFPLGYKELQILSNGEKAPVSDVAYGQALCQIYFGKEETISEWYVQIFGLLIYILGILSIMYPDHVYFFLQRWRYKDPELSGTGRMVEQISGGILSACGIGMMSGIILMLQG